MGQGSVCIDSEWAIGLLLVGVIRPMFIRLMISVGL